MRLHLPAIAATFALAAFGSIPAAGGAAFAAPAAVEGGSGQLLVIMDVSGSMERKDASGTTLMDGARTAVRDFVGSVPGETEIGLRLYGSEYAGDAKAQGCRDTQLAVPIAAASEFGDEIVRAIDEAKPTGFTPIGYALTQAAEDFSVEGERAIVLVSDGEDTCGDPAPCKAARQLARQGVEVRIDTVGLFLQDDPAARQQLECIADATGGTYVPADDTAALTSQLSAVSSRAVARFQASGEEIDGGPSQVQATPIQAGTTYVDDVLKGEGRWYSLELADGQEVRITGTDDGSADYGCCLNYRLIGSDGNGEDHDGGYNVGGTANTYVIEHALDGEGEAGTYYLSVVLDDSTSHEEYGAVEYQFSVEVTDVAAPTDTASATPTETPSATPSETPSAEAESSPAAATPAVPVYLWVLIGLLAAAVVGLGAMILVLMRRVAAQRS